MEQKLNTKCYQKKKLLNSYRNEKNSAKNMTSVKVKSGTNKIHREVCSKKE